MFGLMTKKAHEQRMLDRWHQERHTLDGIQRDAAELNDLLKRAEHERDVAQKQNNQALYESTKARREHKEALAEIEGLKGDVKAAEAAADNYKKKWIALAEVVTGGDQRVNALAEAEGLLDRLADANRRRNEALAELKAMRDAEADREAHAEAERAEIERQADPYRSDRPRTVTVVQTSGLDTQSTVLHRHGVTHIRSASGGMYALHGPFGMERFTLQPHQRLKIEWEDLDTGDDEILVKARAN